MGSRFREQSKQAFLTEFLPHFGILGCFSENGFHRLFSKYNELQYAKLSNEREKKQSHYSISVVTIGILILGQRSSVFTAKA